MTIGSELVGGDKSLDDKLAAWGYTNLKSYQEAYKASLDPLCLKIHGDECQCDGKIGPATAHVINSRFCNVSDFSTVEEARWGDPCINDITVSWDFDKLPGLNEEQTNQAWQSLDQYNQLFELTIKLVKDQYPNTRIFAGLRALLGSVLAWSNLPTGSCAYRAQQAYDNTISWSMKMAIGTIRHEVGHALGLMHTPQDKDSVMYPSMRGQTELNETDIKQMIERGYIKRVSTPDPTPNVRATFYLDGKIYELVGKNNKGDWW